MICDNKDNIYERKRERKEKNRRGKMINQANYIMFFKGGKGVKFHIILYFL